MFIVTVDHNTGHGVLNGQPILLTKDLAKAIKLAKSVKKGRDPTTGFEFHSEETGVLVFELDEDRLMDKHAPKHQRQDGFVFAKMLRCKERPDIGNPGKYEWENHWGEGWERQAQSLL